MNSPLNEQQHAKISLKMHTVPAYKNAVFSAYAFDLIEDYLKADHSHKEANVTPYVLLTFSQQHQQSNFQTLCSIYDIDPVQTLSEALLSRMQINKER